MRKLRRKQPLTKKTSRKQPIASKHKTSMARKYSVFISHSTNDRWIAKQIANLVEQAGPISTFLDERDIIVGDSIPESIRTNIQQCNEFLVLLTKNSINRPWVLIEISAAWGQDKRIIAIIDKVQPREMPEIILPHKAIDLNDFDQYIKQLKERVKGAMK
jgi:hypothetical protein